MVSSRPPFTVVINLIKSRDRYRHKYEGSETVANICFLRIERRQIFVDIFLGYSFPWLLASTFFKLLLLKVFVESFSWLIFGIKFLSISCIIARQLGKNIILKFGSLTVCSRTCLGIGATAQVPFDTLLQQIFKKSIPCLFLNLSNQPDLATKSFYPIQAPLQTGLLLFRAVVQLIRLFSRSHFLFLGTGKSRRAN